jgi:hypothetical protein
MNVLVYDGYSHKKEHIEQNLFFKITLVFLKLQVFKKLTLILNSFNFFPRLPTVSEHINDFVELAAPVPEKKCRLVKYLIPTVVCKVSADL